MPSCFLITLFTYPFEVNAGAVYVPDESHVVVDRDLVMGRSAADIEVYCQKLAETYENITKNPIK